MMTLRHAHERGHADHGWLEAWHSFSFADYYDPAHMGFHSLRVLNDDRIAPGGGFGTHPHRDMEIITYVLSGALEHRDSLGNGRVIRAGDFQYMAAGTGVRHSEFNPSATEATHLLQIWIQPDRNGVPPRYAEKAMAAAPPGKLHLVASPTGRAGSIAIHQDAEVLLAKLHPGDTVPYTPFVPSAPSAARGERHLWLHVAEGQVTLNGTALQAGDSAALTALPAETRLELAAQDAAQVLLFDLA